jgi:hypothetical protein
MSSQLQDLSNKYNSLLTQYTDTYKNYINAINSKDNSLTTVSDTSFVGENNISVLNNSSIESCQTSCTSNDSCSGATFNNNSNSCTLTSGTGNIISTPQSTAIVQQYIYYSYQLQQINAQLLDINQQMMIIINNNYGQFQQTQQQNQQQEQVLQNNYNVLLEERIQIEKMVRQSETLNAAYENGNINVTSNYYSYIILIFIAIFLIFILIRYSIPNGQRGGAMNSDFSKKSMLVFIFIIVIILLNFKIH